MLVVMYRVCVVVVLLAGCGRLGFAPPGGADGAPGDDGDAHGDARAGDGSSALACQQNPGVLFCDGFEDPGLGAWAQTSGSLVRQTAITHTGTAAARATSDGSQQPAVINVAPFNSISSGSLHYRAWFYVPSGFAINKIELFSTNGSGSNLGTVFLVDQEELRVYAEPGLGHTVTTGVTVPRDRWFCIEAHVDVSASNGGMRIELDGTTIGSGSGFATLPTGGYTYLGVGTLFLAAGQSASTVYIDDVAAGTQPLGCS